MITFFELPHDILIKIYEDLSPQDLFIMLETGATTSPKKKEVIIQALFMKKTDEAKLYQQKIIQSWINSRDVYPFPFAHKDNHDEFYKALSDLDILFQVSGLCLINKTEENAQVNHLLSQTTKIQLQHRAIPIKNRRLGKKASLIDRSEMQGELSDKSNPQNRASGYISLIYLASQLSPADFSSSFYTQLQADLDHTDKNLRRNAQSALTEVLSISNEIDPATFLPLIQKNLQHKDTTVHTEAKKSLAKLLPKLNETHIINLLSQINDYIQGIQGRDDSCLFVMLDSLIVLAPSLNDTLIPMNLIEKMQDLLDSSNDISLQKKAENTLTALAPKLNTIQIETLLSRIQGSLEGSNRIKHQRTLTALASRLSETQLITYLPEIQKNFQHSSDTIRDSAQQALERFVTRLSSTQITTMLSQIQGDLEDKNNRIALTAQLNLIALIPRLNDTQLNTLLNQVQSNMGSKLNPFPALGNLLKYCTADNAYATPIASKLIDIINSNDEKNSDIALNILGQWSMFWMQRDNNTEPDRIKDLIESLQPAPNVDSNDNSSLLSLLKEQLLLAVNAQAPTFDMPSLVIKK